MLGPMAADYYERAHAVSAALDDAGSPWAERIEDAIRYASTGTEALMAVRWTLVQALADEDPVPLEVRGDMRSLVRAVSESPGLVGSGLLSG